MSGVSKPFHTDEDKKRFDEEYDRVFGFKVTGKSGARYKIKTGGNHIISCKKLSNPEFESEEQLEKLIEEDLKQLAAEYGDYISKK